MQENSTTIIVQTYLDALAHFDGESPADPLVRDLLGRSVDRLHRLCATLLYRNYPRLARGPVNLTPEQILSAVVERLIKALRQVRPASVRQFFALANQHIRWELNDVARRLEDYEFLELDDSLALKAGREEESGRASAKLSRILAAIDALPDEVREAFNLVRIQGLTQPEAAVVAECSERTLQRRLNRSLVLLTENLGDLRRPRAPRPPAETLPSPAGRSHAQ